jgi:hypothetical protein
MKAGEFLGAMPLSAVNIAYDQALTTGARAAIAAGWDWGDLPLHSNSISGGLDATPPADAQ